jgi:hypothetical protein
MRKDQELFLQAVENQDFDVRDDYSGRNMYGKTCPGAVASHARDVYAALAEYFESWAEDSDFTAGDLIRKCREDNMGRDVIVYLP